MPSMSNNELHLFVFEGARAESKYVEKLERNFLGKRISVKCVYDAEIYQLYKQLKAEKAKEFAFDMEGIGSVDFFNVMSKSQLFLGTGLERFDFVVLKNEIAVGTQ